VRLIYAIAFALFFVAVPMGSPAQALDLPLLSAQCTDDYYEDADGQCDALSAGEVLTTEAILARYGIIATGRTDDEIIAFYLEDLDDMPVGSIRPRNEDAVPTDDDPSNEQLDTIASRIPLRDRNRKPTFVASFRTPRLSAYLRNAAISRRFERDPIRMR
jgi:hypothetical protein